MTKTGDAADPCSCKVSTVATEFGLDGVHQELRERWVAEDGPSVRRLTASFNKRILEAVFKHAGRIPIDGEIDNVYRLLTDANVVDAERTRARERLERDDIPIREVESAFLSHQTLYRHLVDCLDATYERTDQSDTAQVEAWRERLLALEGRTSRVTARGIERLRERGAVDIDSFDVAADITVTCTTCGDFFTVEEFLDERSCDCASKR